MVLWLCGEVARHHTTSAFEIRSESAALLSNRRVEVTCGTSSCLQHVWSSELARHRMTALSLFLDASLEQRPSVIFFFFFIILKKNFSFSQNDVDVVNLYTLLSTPFSYFFWVFTLSKPPNLFSFLERLTVYLEPGICSRHKHFTSGDICLFVFCASVCVFVWETLY